MIQKTIYTTRYALNLTVLCLPHIFVWRLLNSSETIGQFAGRTLLLFRYAGPGTINSYGQLELYAEFKGKMPVGPLALTSNFLSGADIVIVAKVEVPSEGSKTIDRIAEVISAVGST